MLVVDWRMTKTVERKGRCEDGRILARGASDTSISVKQGVHDDSMVHRIEGTE